MEKRASLWQQDLWMHAWLGYRVGNGSGRACTSSAAAGSATDAGATVVSRSPNAACVSRSSFIHGNSRRCGFLTRGSTSCNGDGAQVG